MNSHTFFGRCSLVTASVGLALSLASCGPQPSANSGTSEGIAAAPSTEADLTSSPVVSGWGPKSTRAGVGFNLQPDGSSAMWVKMGGYRVNSSNYIQLGSTKITRLNQTPTGLTFGVPAEAYSSEGDRNLALFEADTGRSIDIGVFKVLPAE